jgi:hypothetical protein
MVSVAVMFMVPLSSALAGFHESEDPIIWGIFTTASSFEWPACAKVRLHVKILPSSFTLSEDLCSCSTAATAAGNGSIPRGARRGHGILQ